LCIFLLGDFGTFIFMFFTWAYMVWCSVVQKSSANYLATRVFSQKGFAMFIFGHTFLSDSWKFFWLLCKVNWKNNNLIYVISKIKTRA
jgi:hypothetical protein